MRFERGVLNERTIELQQNAEAVDARIAEESEEVMRRAQCVDAHRGWCQDAWTTEFQEDFATKLLRE